VHYTLTLQFGVHTQRGVRLDHVSDDQLTQEELQEFEEELAEAGAEKKVESMEGEMTDLLARWDAGLDVDGGEQTVTDRLAAREEDKVHKRFCEAECEHELDMAVMKQKFELGRPVGPEEVARLEEIRKAGDELVAIAARRVALYRVSNPRTYGMLQVNKKNLVRQIAADEFEIKFRRKQARGEDLSLDPFVRVPCKPITLWGTPHTIEPKKADAKEHEEGVKAKEAEKKKQSTLPPEVMREKPRADVREAFVQARKSDRGDIKIPDLPPRGLAPTRNGVPTAASSTARRINLTQYREMMVRAK
jgi:hypothetical protein